MSFLDMSFYRWQHIYRVNKKYDKIEREEERVQAFNMFHYALSDLISIIEDIKGQ